VFPQVNAIYAPGSIPGSSTTESAGQKAFWLACPRINIASTNAVYTIHGRG
jgi:hypothetical protein